MSRPIPARGHLRLDGLATAASVGLIMTTDEIFVLRV
jgi:hypothetical protein